MYALLLQKRYSRPKLLLTLRMFCIVSIQSFIISCSTTLEPYDSDMMAREFLAQFHHQTFSVGQQLAFNFQEKKILHLVIKELEGAIPHLLLSYGFLLKD